MTAQEYIISELKKLREPIRHAETEPEKLEEAIYARVMSKKFRKLKASDFVKEFVKDSVHIAVSEGKPLAIGCAHGGTKPWHFPEYPEVDWAELFVIIYHVQWMRYIAEVYERGVWLEFYSMDVCLERMNNLPRSETDQYSASFIKIIEFVQQYLPENLTITYRRYGDDYDDIHDYDKELDIAIEANKKLLGGKLPTLTERQKYGTEMNVRPLPGQTLDPLWREKVELIHMSIEQTKTFVRYLEDRRFVPSCATPVEGTLTVGSTKKSLAKFWFAAGALEPKGDSFIEVVLTPKQLESLAFIWKDVKIKGLVGKNFSKIRIVN